VEAAPGGAIVDSGFGYLVKFLMLSGIVFVFLSSLTYFILTDWRYLCTNALWLLEQSGYDMSLRLELPKSVWMIETKTPYLTNYSKNETIKDAGL
jgi:hypothetical protein